MSFIVHILPICKINIPFIKGDPDSAAQTKRIPQELPEVANCCFKPSLCAFMLLSPQSDHTHQITWLSTEQKASILLYLWE